MSYLISVDRGLAQLARSRTRRLHITSVFSRLNSRSRGFTYARPLSQNSRHEAIYSLNPSTYGWRYHLDNTVQFILWASFGSAAIHLLNMKQKYHEKERKLSTKIAILKDIIRRVGEGEDVDLVKELKVGKTEDEQEWEDVMKQFREDADVERAPPVQEVDQGQSEAGIVSPQTHSTLLKPLAERMDTKIIKSHDSGWFWKT